MTDRPTTSLALRQSRERIVQDLCRHFAEDRLELSEFEARLDIANRAITLDELERLTSDLPGLSPAATSVAAASARPPASAPSARPDQPLHRRFLVAVMSGVERKGKWRPPRKLFSYAFWGGVDLDFREAILAPGVTELTAIATMGGIDIVVPPELPVECHGMGIMGGFEHEDTEPAPDDDPDRPRLRITGFALMGGVQVSIRLPGESARDASRRRKEERREREKARRLDQRERRRLRGR